jgi:hypothetical protein
MHSRMPAAIFASVMRLHVKACFSLLHLLLLVVLQGEWEPESKELNNIGELCEDIHRAVQAKVQANMATLLQETDLVRVCACLPPGT